jgi:hypothetical protein
MYYQDKDPVLKMFDSVKSDTKLIIPISIFKKMYQYKVPIKKLKEYVEDFQSFRNKWIGYNLGNSCVLYQSTKGNKYTISIYPDIRYEGSVTKELGTASFNMWDENGCESLLSLENCSWESAPTVEFLDKLYNTIKDYEEGIIHCSDCGKPLKVGEVAGSYFAGRYCEHCWETKWKAIEAAETYD